MMMTVYKGDRGEGGSHEKVTEGDGGGVSGPPKKGDVIYERPLRDLMLIFQEKSNTVLYRL